MKGIQFICVHGNTPWMMKSGILRVCNVKLAWRAAFRVDQRKQECPNKNLTKQTQLTSCFKGANLPALRTILPSWFDYLVESFSYKEVQF